MGLSALGYRAKLRLDLKDSGALWSDAELNRSISRAVDDLSRHLPWEKVYEDTLSFTITDESITSPATTSLSAVVAAQSIDVAAGGFLTIAGQPDVPRALRITIVDADNSTYGATFIIRGSDKDGVYQEEILQYARGYSKTLQGKQEFKYVYEVELNQDYGSHALDTASVGYGLFTDPWIYLGYHPIRPETETVTDSAAAVTLVRDTDYIMDYINGAIKSISTDSSLTASVITTTDGTSVTCSATAATKLPAGTKIRIDSEVMLVTAVSTVTLTVTRAYAGTTAATHIASSAIYIGGMAQGITYLIDYTKSRLGISISSLIPIATRITRVEYPVDSVPQQFVNYNIFGDFMYIASKTTGKSQEEMSTSKEHIAIYYERKHMPPGEFAPGSYPENLDDMVIHGAGGYALLIEALQYEQAAATAITSMNSALTNVIKYLDNNTVGGLDLDVAGKLALVTSTIRTTITAATDAALTYLANVGSLDIDLATVGATAWLLEGELLINAVPVGSNVPENFANYARAKVDIANSRVSAAVGGIQEANTRLEHLRSYLEEANGYNQLAQGFLAEATQRAETINANLVLADRFRAEGLQRLIEFNTMLKDKAEYRKRTSSTPLRQPA